MNSSSDKKSTRTFGKVIGGAVLGTVLAVSGGIAAAQDNYPTRPITIVLPYGPGNSTDIVTRVFAQRLAEKVGQSVIVENKAGAGTLIGTEHVAKAPADGYTLLMATNAFSIIPHMYKISFDPQKDFVPVAPVLSTGIVLLARPDFPANNLTELAAMAKKDPGKYSYSTWGVGGVAHLTMELFRDAAGIDLLHVPYKGGGAASARAVMAGETDVGFDVVATALPQIRAGKVKALGSFYAKRTADLPDTQTIVEAGYPEATLAGWTGVFAPAGTPQAVIDKLTKVSMEIVADKSFGDRLKELGSAAFIGTPEDLRKTTSTESDNVKRLVAEGKINIAQ